MILQLSEVIKEKLIQKIKDSHAYALLTDEVTDISNICHLLTFLRYYDIEEGTTKTSFVHTSDLLEESETTSTDAESIFNSLCNTLQNDLDLNLEELIGFCSDGASVMTGSQNGVAAKFKQQEERKTMISIHCICHRLALACGDTGDELKFIEEFELSMIQLWAFLRIRRRD